MLAAPLQSKVRHQDLTLGIINGAGIGVRLALPYQPRLHRVLVQVVQIFFFACMRELLLRLVVLPPKGVGLVLFAIGGGWASGTRRGSKGLSRGGSS